MAAITYMSNISLLVLITWSLLLTNQVSLNTSHQNLELEIKFGFLNSLIVCSSRKTIPMHNIVLKLHLLAHNLIFNYFITALATDVYFG